MLIDRLDVYRLSIPFTTHRPAANASDAVFNAASAAYSRMGSLFVKVTLDDGRSGWGEAFGHAGNVATAALLAGAVGQFFIGQSAGILPTKLNSDARRAFHSYGQTGPFIYALSAVDTALWDLAAQQAGLPLHRMLGGSGDGVVPTYASLVSYDNDPQLVSDEVARACTAGFRAIKLHEVAFPAVDAARRVAPKDVALMVDVNCAWTEASAAETFEQWREVGLEFVEEPLWPVDDYAALARLRNRSVRVAAGENVAGVSGARALIEAGAVDVFQPSVAKIGGISAVLDTLDFARDRDVRVLPHCFYYGPGLLATAHIVASLGGSAGLEMPYLRYEALLHEAMAPAPSLALSSDAGLGFRPDYAVIDKYRVDHFTVQ
ncbi:mandelate racemase/muconate lactonizing enzyme family protein [Burkholderia multivorans]|nr:mandelate racemase/muconate lactonizing enzyme family protein [Burkholderia multivorans]